MTRPTAHPNTNTADTPAATNTHFDVIIVGAGISGIGMACHLSEQCPNKSFAILERRQAIGGTWDLFRYPGIRSDSDMMSFGFKFRPWTDSRILADGASIKQYVNDTAKAFGIDKKIHFGLKITHANFSSQDKLWYIHALNEATGDTATYTCQTFVSATGYYNYDKGHLPNFAGVEDFKGQIIHPQHWPEDLDYRNKKVVVIGSGATAVTLIPAMADKTAHITMLQRSPSYVYTLPDFDKVVEALKGKVPDKLLYKVFRRRNIFVQRSIFKLSRRFPKAMKLALLTSVQKQLGKDFDMSHFTPRYMPWDERLCAVPDGDLFTNIREGKASVVTDHIDRFTASGILLKSGKTLEADIIVTATGLELQMLGGIDLHIDDQPINVGEKLTYKGVLIQDVPNFAYLFGYTNISWTLKIDMAADYVCRLINEMDSRHARTVTALADPNECTADSIVGSLSSGYVKRGDDVMPRQGKQGAWFVTHHYEKDCEIFGEPLDDKALNWAA